MFVKSDMDELVTYRKSSFNVNIKPNTVTYVDEAIISAAELKACYGDRITIISPELNEVILNEIAGKPVEAATPVPEVKEGEAPTEEQIILQDAANAEADKLGLVPEASDEEVKNALNENSEVKAFLEGETDKLPEGTEEITVEEAERLKKEKEEAEKETREPEEYKAKLVAADAYFADIEQDDDSDKHLKLVIKERLVEEAEDRCYDNVSLMEEIEKLFPEEKAKLEKEAEKLNAQSKKDTTKQKANKSAKSAKSNKTNSKTKNK